MKKMLYLFILFLLLLSFYANKSNAAYVCVDPAGGGDYTDIQSALNDADDSGESDVIQVVQGIYSGNFDYYSTQGQDLTLFGGYTAGCAARVVDPSNTILDGNKTDRTLNISEGSGNITVEGFTLQNGSSTGYGAGLSISASVTSGTSGDITVNNNIVIDNTANGPNGGGINVNSQSNLGTAGLVTITNNKILRNSAQSYAGVYARSFSITGSSSDVVFTGNTISGNTATLSGGGAFIYTEADGNSGNITCTHNTFTQNTAQNNYGALFLYTDTDTGTAGNIIFVNNTITNNVADNYAGASIQSQAGTSDTPGTVTITNNTITENTAHTQNGGLDLYQDNNTANVYNNIIWGNISPQRADINLTGAGTANGYNNDYTVMYGTWDSSSGETDVDPLFIDPDNGDYRLRSSSPCKDKGNNSAPSIPADDFEGDTRPIDATVDIGADEVSIITTCVSNATELQGALDDVSVNGKGDVIMVQQGQYTRSGNFSSSLFSDDVTLLGGFTSACETRQIAPGKTILNGDGSGKVLSISTSSSGDIMIEGFTVQNGATSSDGAGIAAQTYINSSGSAGNILIKNNIVKSNSSTADAGGISAYSYSVSGYNAGDITLINNVITNNTATDLGGGANLMSFTTAGGAAGKITCTNNTFADNHADQGGGVRFYVVGSPGGVVNAFNNIIWSNTATSSSADVHLVKGTGIALGFNNNAQDTGGDAWDFDINNMGETPMFTSDYHLKPNSPCIDTGINAAAYLPNSDIDGNNRIADGNRDGISTVDMGAFEYIQKGALSFLLLLLN